MGPFRPVALSEASTAQLFTSYENFLEKSVSFRFFINSLNLLIIVIFIPEILMPILTQISDFHFRWCFLFPFFEKLRGKMNVNQKKLAAIFGVSDRTIRNWEKEGMPTLGHEYNTAAVIKWYVERDNELVNGKLMKEVADLRSAGETDLVPGTIDYERYRLTKAQADAQELKNLLVDSTLIESEACAFVLSKIAGNISTVLSSFPLSLQRQFPELTPKHIDYMKLLLAKGSNACVGFVDSLPDLLNEYRRTKDRSYAEILPAGATDFDATRSDDGSELGE